MNKRFPQMSLGVRLIIITIISCGLITASFFVFPSVADKSAEKSVSQAMNESVKSLSDSIAETISAKVKGIEFAAGEASQLAALKSSPNEIKRTVLKVKNDYYSQYGVNFDYALYGIGVFDGKDYSNNEAYIAAKTDGTALSFDSEKNCAYYVYMDNDDGRAVVCSINNSYFDITSEGNEYIEIRNSDGSSIFTYGDESILKSKKVCTSESNTEIPSLTVFAAIDSGKYIVAEEKNMTMPIVVSVVIALAAAIASYFAVKGSFASVNVLTDRINSMANGDFTSPVNNASWELKELAESTQRLASNVSRNIESACEGIDNKSQFNLNGDFRKIQTAVERFFRNNKTETVPVKKEDNKEAVKSAKIIEEKSSVNTSSAGEIAEHISDFSEKYGSISKHTAKAASEISEAGKILSDEKAQMDDLVNAITIINEQSMYIKKIISDIEDIAFQTNILALNAAVEAARAGDSGRGFAVVADEVRNLAMKSSESAKSTSSIIEKTLTAVKNGTQIAAENAETLEKAIEASDNAAEAVKKIEAGISDNTEDFRQLCKKTDALENELKLFSDIASAHKVLIENQN